MDRGAPGVVNRLLQETVIGSGSMRLGMSHPPVTTWCAARHSFKPEPSLEGDLNCATPATRLALISCFDKQSPCGFHHLERYGACQTNIR